MVIPMAVGLATMCLVAMIYQGRIALPEIGIVLHHIVRRGAKEMSVKGEHGVRTPVLREVTLPNGKRMTILRESTFREGVRAANNALRTERAGA
jgi:hypothetical protein